MSSHFDEGNCVKHFPVIHYTTTKVPSPSTSVTRKKSPNVNKSCPKMISVEKLKILTSFQKLPQNVRDLGKLIVAKCCKTCPKSNKSPNLVTLPSTYYLSHTGQVCDSSNLCQQNKSTQNVNPEGREVCSRQVGRQGTTMLLKCSMQLAKNFSFQLRVSLQSRERETFCQKQIFTFL